MAPKAEAEAAVPAPSKDKKLDKAEKEGNNEKRRV